MQVLPGTCMLRHLPRHLPPLACQPSERLCPALPCMDGAQVRAFAQEHKLGNPVRTMAPLPISICCLLRRGWTGGACRCLQGAPLSTVFGSMECGATNDGPTCWTAACCTLCPIPAAPLRRLPACLFGCTMRRSRRRGMPDRGSRPSFTGRS